MNLKIGGEGGGKFYSVEHMMKCSKAGNDSFKKKMEDETYKKLFSKTCSIIALKLHSDGKLKSFSETVDWKGKNLTEIHKKNISESMKGKQNKEFNSQFGTKWITNGIENKKVKNTDIDSYLGWKQGRIIKNSRSTS